VSVLGELVAAVEPNLRAYAVDDPGPARFGGTRLAERAFALEAIYEAYLMHYGHPRAFDGMDEDLRLLAGDALYAVGLSRLAERDDLVAVAELADLISRCARAHAEGEPERAEHEWRRSTAALSS
jgi:hypothetical protein